MEVMLVLAQSLAITGPSDTVITSLTSQWSQGIISMDDNCAGEKRTESMLKLRRQAVRGSK
ncbi:hypothetical protein KIN20_004180 [Parelaphostrongylus tenuis]|uniref:Uncharacterized protein n=1 Tax=Parelaphostrongylus tenuis TaxID=148309 RepID=A0AAD5M1B8_PARTN|nr:hypothetical protein KIN20_004180 [Parelaphostrongylus tenuis]